MNIITKVGFTEKCYSALQALGDADKHMRSIAEIIVLNPEKDVCNYSGISLSIIRDWESGLSTVRLQDETETRWALFVFIPQLSKPAAKALRGMTEKMRQHVKEAIAKLPKGDVTRIEGSPGVFRLRVGSIRVLFYYPTTDAIIIEKISPRGDAYKGGR